MTHLLRWAGLAALLLAVAAPPAPARAQAGIFYVATDGADQSGRAGSAAQPWATIGYALGRVPDGSTILVRPGTYSGRVRLDRAFADGVTVRSEEPYRARLRHSATVVTVYYGQGISLEGFDIAHSGPGAGPLVIQIQDLIGPPGGAERVERITLRNNIIHDSYDNDLLKINNGARQVAVLGNIFYNQSGSDEHIDINSVHDVLVQDNIFFNDFAASGRANGSDTGSYIVVKDSNDGDDGILGAGRIRIRRNIFLNWQGDTGTSFVLVGQDGKSYYEAYEVLVENNLVLGNSGSPIRAPFGVKGARDVTFRHNTVVGDMPGQAFAFRLNTEGANQPNRNIRFYNNIWADPGGSMGDFSDTPIGETESFVLDGNLYWNGGQALPEGADDQINPGDDAAARLGDPRLPAQAGLATPHWDAANGQFGEEWPTIAAAFAGLVERYGRPGAGSAALDGARPDQAPSDDILGNPRPGDGPPDQGAYEAQAAPPAYPFKLQLPLLRTPGTFGL